MEDIKKVLGQMGLNEADVDKADLSSPKSNGLDVKSSSGVHLKTKNHRPETETTANALVNAHSADLTRKSVDDSIKRSHDLVKSFDK